MKQRDATFHWLTLLAIFILFVWYIINQTWYDTHCPQHVINKWSVGMFWFRILYLLQIYRSQISWRVWVSYNHGLRISKYTNMTSYLRRLPFSKFHCRNSTIKVKHRSDFLMIWKRFRIIGFLCGELTPTPTTSPHRIPTGPKCRAKKKSNIFFYGLRCTWRHPTNVFFCISNWFQEPYLYLLFNSVFLLQRYICLHLNGYNFIFLSSAPWLITATFDRFSPNKKMSV